MLVDYDPSGFEFYFFLLGFYLRDFAAYSDGASPADAGVVLYFILPFVRTSRHAYVAGLNTL
jgi:hypothetical protein